MSWYDTKQAAVDPDNPLANEQFPFSEHNAMVAYLKDQINNKTVDLAGIANDMIMVYDLANDKFVFEAKSVVAALNDLTDVVISGVPADNEVVAYDTATSKFINQTAAEALLATTTQLSALETDAVLEADFNATTFMYATADNTPLPKTRAETMAILSGSAGAEFLFNTQKIGGVVNPTTAQQVATKNYADTRLFTKEAVTTFTNGYIPVYRTASGKFEMEDGGGAAGLPVVDTTNVVKGSADGTKLMRFEVDGIATGTTRVMTIPDKSITLCDTAEAMLLSGTQAMTGDLDMGGRSIDDVADILSSDTYYMSLTGGTNVNIASTIILFGKDCIIPAYRGYIQFDVTNAAKSANNTAMQIIGATDTPVVHVLYGLDMNAKDINDVGALILNDASELTIASGVVTVTQSYHVIDTESDAASDDLTTISGGQAGQILILGAANDARTVVVKNGGTIALSFSDFSLDTTLDTLMLICVTPGYWKELSRSNNGAA